MRTLALMALLGATDGGSVWSTLNPNGTWRFPVLVRHDYWEQGPVGCSNGARPEARQRDAGMFLVCDARKDGGR